MEDEKVDTRGLFPCLSTAHSQHHTKLYQQRRQTTCGAVVLQFKTVSAVLVELSSVLTLNPTGQI